MKQLIDLYNEDTTKFLELLEKNNIKVIGCHQSFKLQIVYDEENDKLMYFDGSNLSTNIGSEIQDIDKLFTKGLKKSIDYIESKKNIIKNYNYLLCELYDNEIYLISVIDKNNKVDKDVNKLCKSLNIKSSKVIFEGKLNSHQIHLLQSFIMENTLICKEEYYKFVEEIFSIKIKENILEIIFNIFIKDKDKCLQFIHSCTDNNNEIVPNDNIKELETIYKECKTDKDFIDLISNYKTYNKLVNIGVKLNRNEYQIQEEALSPEILSLIKQKGNIVKKLYENYVLINYITEKMVYNSSSKRKEYVFSFDKDKFSWNTTDEFLNLVYGIYGKKFIELDVFNYDNTIKVITYDEESLAKIISILCHVKFISKFNGDSKDTDDLAYYIGEVNFSKIINKNVIKQIEEETKILAKILK